ncbi:ABC transporter ATP-binding protein [Roseospira visakhapatnamensis]|uniref:NitT/TauT family transport system ATP-binding protein n=1 Tax=Roseospira visakhapatnamensis TaxID=390880 RepID=A0A7W6RCP7_9PROT|nr:ATP-binding cassette domain-containing protein [Roseospira visakhapatnamensis]MBB4265726.1 NitT/TauT family transport system ATP-binding protein [Roseospira visakhapatnamensis]
MTLTPTPDAAASVLAWHDVSVSIGRTAILDRLTLAVPAGGLLTLVGPSGCGKTTLLSIAAGLLKPGAGRVETRARRIALMFQDSRLLPWRRARDNAAFGLRCQGMPRRQRLDAAQRLLESLGLAPEDGDKFPHQLSGGMRQRVALARALAIEPDLLLLDEPFNALDSVLRRDLQDLVRQTVTARGVAAVFVTHDLTEAIRVCDRLVVMAGPPGRVAFSTGFAQPADARDDAAVLAGLQALWREPAVAEALGATPGRRRVTA